MMNDDAAVMANETKRISAPGALIAAPLHGAIERPASNFGRAFLWRVGSSSPRRVVQ